MKELNELTDNKSLEQLQAELSFQLSNGESEGGTICSHIKHCINKLSLKL